VKSFSVLANKMALGTLLVVAHDSQLAKALEIFYMQCMLSLGEQDLFFAFGKWSIFWILHHLFAIDSESESIIGVDDKANRLLFGQTKSSIEMDNKVVAVAKIAIERMAQLVAFGEVEPVDP